MDLKKLALSDQFPYFSITSPRRKVVSGFCLGLVVSLFVLCVVFFNVSFKAPLLNPVLQGFSTFASRNNSSSSTSILSWPVYFSRSTSCSSSDSSCNGTIANKFEYVMVMNGTLGGNVSDNGESRIFFDSGGKGEILETAHVGNFSEKVKNGSFSFEAGGKVRGESLLINGSRVDENGNFTSVVNFSKNVGNQNISAEGNSVKFQGELLNAKEQFSFKNAVSVKQSNGGRDKVPKAIIFGNLTDNGDNGGVIGSEEKSPETNDGGNSYNGSKTSSFGSEMMTKFNSFNGDCDIFHGRWVSDDTKPYYAPGSCPYIDRDFDCHLNKRPDDEFVKWKWQPYNCDIPSLNGTDFLERLRGQKLIFVGDSLNRNMWESLVCILRHSIPNKKRVYEISGRTEFKKGGFYAFRFEDYNCSVDFVSSPFLVRESTFIGTNGSFETLRLDLMDQTTSMYQDADILVFNTGHWWTHEKTSKGEDYYQEGNHLHQRLKVLEAYKRALGTWARWVDKNIDEKRSQVIFRGYSVTHFRGGQWNSGGQCHKETEPIFNETYLAKYPSKMRALEYVLQEMQTPVVYLNISRLTDYRKDGHPSIYRKEYKTLEEQIAGERIQDCSHWCLPGVPDTWNELLYASLLKTGKGPWRN
ncbi:hypothetical protein ACH5RR_035613 [Cinchona calisaya]|uniref:Trichome birefringence-like N-terminal domain-containing protein n=1 Tax=Cinchona calisaya TaxID=153742 RepID=A0ABD2Y0R0_9GENT